MHRAKRKTPAGFPDGGFSIYLTMNARMQERSVLYISMPPIPPTPPPRTPWLCSSSFGTPTCGNLQMRSATVALPVTYRSTSEARVRQAEAAARTLRNQADRRKDARGFSEACEAARSPHALRLLRARPPPGGCAE